MTRKHCSKLRPCVAALFLALPRRATYVRPDLASCNTSRPLTPVPSALSSCCSASVRTRLPGINLSPARPLLHFDGSFKYRFFTLKRPSIEHGSTHSTFYFRSHLKPSTPPALPLCPCLDSTAPRCILVNPGRRPGRTRRLCHCLFFARPWTCPDSRDQGRASTVNCVGQSSSTWRNDGESCTGPSNDNGLGEGLSRRV